MNVLEELRSLDMNEPGRWPLPFRIAAVVLVLILVSAAGIYWFVVKVEIPELERAVRDEADLRASFEDEQEMAANFDDYRQQLDAIQRDFGTMLDKLPGQTDVENLLDDISQTALSVGLDQRIFDPGDEVPRDFYAELPVRVRYEGSYHEIGDFVSGVARLPRIVTMHNIRIQPLDIGGEEERLQFDATAKTYRYLEETP